MEKASVFVCNSEQNVSFSSSQDIPDDEFQKVMDIDIGQMHLAFPNGYSING